MDHDIEAAELKRRHSTGSSLDAGLSAAVLDKLLPSANAKVGGKYVGKNRYTFAIHDATKDRIDLGALDAYLAAADLNNSSPTISSLLESEELYVICTTLKARRLELETESSVAVGGDATLPDVKLGSGTAKLSVKRKADDSTAFHSDLPLVFAFQAAKILFEDGAYRKIAVEVEDVQLMGEEKQTDTGWLAHSTPGFLVRLDQATG